MSERVFHGKVQNIYRVINHEHDDLDLTRAQAIRLYQQLRFVLYPRASRAPKRSRQRRRATGAGSR